MGLATLQTAQRLYRDCGLKAVVVVVLKKVISPFAQAGSIYFMERDLRAEMPPLRPIPGIVAREGSFSDLHLLDAVENGALLKQRAIQRLQKGDRWFIGVEESTGKLTNYRWASLTSGFVLELGRTLTLEPGQAYIYDLQTAPEFRRRGIEGFTRQFTYDRLHRQYGADRITVYICADNHASLQAGRAYLTPVGRIWYLKVRGFARRIFMIPTGRTPRLTEASAEFPQAAAFARLSNSRR